MNGQTVTRSVLELRDLEVRRINPHQDKPILAGLSLDVAEGETLCLVGESGSGKTMTALAVMGLLPRHELQATSGRIRLADEELIGAAPRRLRQLRATRMAMIFQEPMAALNPVMPIGRQIEEVISAHTDLSHADRRRRILDMLEQAGLSDVERISAAYPHQLSGGQRQRAMIAMALVLRPKLLIADEPTSALDVRTQKQILTLIRDLRDRHGTATLFITHDMGVVAEIADRVAVMQQGRIVESGPLKAILTAPAHGHTRKLLASVPSLVPRPPRPLLTHDVVLRTQSLSKTFRAASWFRAGQAVDAVIDVTVNLERGRTLGIVGESGSGKSTLARCVLRLIDPSQGHIHLAGVDITALSRMALKPYRQEIQIVFQDPYRSLNPRFSVVELITEGPVNFGVARAQALQDAADLLALVGLPPHLLHAYPHQLSGGQRQRIALARALALKPRVLVADEAVSALDMSTQAEILRLLADIQKRLGIAILFITHDLRVAAQICDDVAIMQAGRIVEYGPAADILTRPRQPYTRDLIESAPGRGWDFANLRPAPVV